MADNYGLPKIPFKKNVFLNDDENSSDEDDDDDDILSVDANLAATVKKRPNEKEQENIWFNQLKMNSTIAEALGTNSLEDEAIKYKNYLNTLKRNYLENLSLSCPTNKQANRKVATVNTTNNNKDNQYASIANKSATTRRKILFTPDAKTTVKSEKLLAKQNGQSSDDDESLSLLDNIVIPKQQQDGSNSQQPLSTTQILSRLVQIREYLKQAYSMLTTLQTSNDITSYSGQLEKLNSLIEHLRDQEKGYMDLLNSIIAYQNATKENISLTSASERDKKIQQQQQSTIQTEESTQELDMSLRDLLFKIRQPSKSQQQQKPKAPKMLKEQANPKQQNESAINSARKDTTESSFNSLVGSLMSDTMQIDNDPKYGSDDNLNRDELEELQEKERLLKSILARREEIRALEGRRKALEALKKAAQESERDFLGKLDESEAASAVSKKTQTSTVKKFEDENDENSNDDSGNDNDDDENEEEVENKADMEPLFKTFYKYLNTGKPNELDEEEGEDDVKLLEDIFDRESVPIVSEKEHRDKELLKGKLESLQEKKRLVDNLLQDLSRLKERADLKDGEVKEKPVSPITYSSIKSELVQNQNELDIIKSSVDVTNHADHTAKKAEKILTLLENQEKLEKLHAMQNRLNQLKQIVGHFNDEKSIKSMLTNANDDESDPKDIAVEDLSADEVEEEEEEEDEDKKEFLFEKYKDEATLNITELNSLLNTNANGSTLKSTEAPVITNSEEYAEQKKKLAEAKLKLKQLQDLITTIQNMPAGEQNAKSIESKLTAIPQTNKFKINDGKRVKEFITEQNNDDDDDEQTELPVIRKQQQNMNRSNISPKADLPQISILNESAIMSQNKNNLDLTIFSDNGLNTSINNAAAKAIQQERLTENSSPSDLLWSQMKQQLNLREKLRGKKKELEDLIKNERYYLYEKMNKSKSCDTIVNQEESDGDDFIDDETIDEDDGNDENEDCDDDQREAFKTVDLDESLVQRTFSGKKLNQLMQQQQEQENLCSADELILQANKIKDDVIPLNASARSNSNLESSLVSSVIYNMNTINDLKKQMEENNHTFECMLKNQNMLSNLLEKNLNAIHNKPQQAAPVQHQAYHPQQQYGTSPSASYYTQTPFLGMMHPPPPPPMLQPQNLNDSYYQYNNHLQMQQLMMNLNAAYREIGLQRNEINNLTMKMNDIDKQIQQSQVSSSYHQSRESSFIANQQPLKQQKSDLESTYLKTYLNMKNTSKSLNSYDNDNGGADTVTTDDYNLKLEKRNLKRLYNKTKYRDESSSSSTNSSKTRTRSSVSTSLTRKSSSDMRTYSRQVQRKSTITNVSSNTNTVSASTITNPITNVTSVTGHAVKLAASSTLSSFDELRETIYSEVATLISQNETRPHYLLNLFRELQHLKSKNSRDQALKSIFNISSRNDTTSKRNTANGDEDDEDNLDDTVIYLKMNQEAKNLFDYSTDSSVKDSFVSSQVKLLSNKILKMLHSDNKIPNQILTADFLNELTDNIISIMNQRKENHDYLRLYKSQLISYLKEALQKYEKRQLDRNINRIMFDVSDILLNELTFYSIMNNSNSNFHKKFQQQQQQEEQNDSSALMNANGSNTNVLVKSSPSLSSSLSSSKKKTSTFFNSSTATLTRTKESLLLNNSSSSETDNKNDKNENYYDDEFENEDDDDVAAAEAGDDNDYEVTADDDGDFNVEDNAELKMENENDDDDDDDDDTEEGTSDDDDEDDDDDDADKQILYNIGDGSSIRKQLTAMNKMFHPNSDFVDLNSYEKYQMVDPTARSGITTGSGTVESLPATSSNDFNKYLRSNDHMFPSGNSHFIELAQSELKPYSRIGSDEDENEADDDDEQFSDNLETAVSRQPDIAVVQEHKQLSTSQKTDIEDNNEETNTKEDILTVDDIPEKFTYEMNTSIWKDLKENGIVNVEQILLQTAPDDLVELDELLPPSASSSQHQTPQIESQVQNDRHSEDSDDAQISDFVLINNAKNLNNDAELNNKQNNESDV